MTMKSLRSASSGSCCRQEVCKKGICEEIYYSQLSFQISWSLEVGRGQLDIQPVPVNTVEGWLALCRRYSDDAQALRAARRPDGAWLNAGFAVECCLKAVIMKKERLNGWPAPDIAPELWTHDLRGLFKRLGIEPTKFDHRHPVAPALKTVLDWRRNHGYSTGKLPVEYANNLCDAAFGSTGVIEWLAARYQLNI